MRPERRDGTGWWYLWDLFLCQAEVSPTLLPSACLALQKADGASVWTPLSLHPSPPLPSTPLPRTQTQHLHPSVESTKFRFVHTLRDRQLYTCYEEEIPAWKLLIVQVRGQMRLTPQRLRGPSLPW